MTNWTSKRIAAEYLTETRLKSIKQYLNDVAAGIDTVIAWNAHKARMAEK